MSALSAMKRALDAALGIFYPELCQLCGTARASAREGYVCSDCRCQVRWVKEPWCQRCGKPFAGDLTTPFECANCRGLDLHFSQARSGVVFDGPVREALHRYKYNRQPWFEPFLADLLLETAGSAVNRADWDVIIPVPLHRLKQSEREFNQAEVLARHLGAHGGIPVNKRALKRVEYTRTQTQLSRNERLANVRKAFAMREGLRLNGERVMLFDDVMTTGATADACARVLLQNGASRVGVWTLARGM
jgi:competence protein ComFC